jgi:hypothetical protein
MNLFKEVPIPASIIRRIEAVATHKKQMDTMVFTNRQVRPLEECEHEENDEEDEDDLEPDIITGADEQSNNVDNPPGIFLESPGAGESAGVHNKTSGVDQETPGV